MTDECEASKEWARQHLACRAQGTKAAAAVVHAEAQLPLSPADAFQLMAHPDNAHIFRGIERCTFRKVLQAPTAAGRQTVEVENESDWHFLFFKGSIRTRMVVEEDPAAGTICVRLAPEGGTAPLQHMTGKWRFAPGSVPRSSLIVLDQEVHPRGLPPFFHNGFRAMAALQVRKTFEDLYAEALRINAGRPSLAPYASVAHKEVAAQEEQAQAERAACCAATPDVREEGGEDPVSVLAAAYDVESGSSPPSSRGAAAAAAARSGVRSHPIASLLDFACLAGATGASLAAEAAASAAAAAAEAAAAAAKEAEAAALSWRTRVYSWLQRLWLASNAALGMAPDAVAQLEEMAVLV